MMETALCYLGVFVGIVAVAWIFWHLGVCVGEHNGEGKNRKEIDQLTEIALIADELVINDMEHVKIALMDALDKWRPESPAIRRRTVEEAMADSSEMCA